MDIRSDDSRSLSLKNKKLSPDFSCAYKLREQPKIFGFMPDPARYDCRMNFEPLRQLHNGKG